MFNEGQRTPSALPLGLFLVTICTLLYSRWKDAHVPDSLGLRYSAQQVAQRKYISEKGLASGITYFHICCQEV